MTNGDTISTSGLEANGFYASAVTGAIAMGNTGAISTMGDDASAISSIRSGASGTITIANSGVLTTQGDYAHGIYAQDNNGDVVINNTGEIDVHGSIGSKGIYVNRVGSGAITITNTATIKHDIPASYQYGIEAKAGSNATIIVNNDGTIAGSSFGIVTWSRFIPHTGSTGTVNIGATGVVQALFGVTMDMSDANTLNIAHGGLISSRSEAIQFRSYGGTSTPHDTVNNSGVIESSRDQIMGTNFATAAGSVVQFSNARDGVMTGYMTADKAAVTVNNDGIWNLRHFANMDTNPGRETLAVAISDFGTSGNNTINNAGTLALLGRGSETVTTLDTTGMYLPFGYTFNTMAATSPVQGQLLGVQTFNNSGTIDITANPVAGDVLVISGGHSAGVDGGGVFVANGGVVKMNTVLNEGGANSQSDILVLDSTQLGSSPTLIALRPTGGNGALTVGNGIALVEVLNKSASADGVFALSSRVAAGAYDYNLFHNGVDSDSADGNWYLRNTYIPAPTPENPDPAPVPIIRPEVPVSMVIPPLAMEYGYAMLDTLHERVGETYLNSAPVTEQRVVWCKDASQNFKCVVNVPVAAANGADATDKTRWASSGWARLMGDRGLHQPDNFLRRGPNYDYTFGGIQAGLDVYAREQADGTLDKAGIYAGYGQISSGVKGQFGGKAGSVDMDAYTLAAYWTHHSPNGWYTDAVVQGTWYATDAKSIYGQQLKPDGFGILASLEGGYSFKLGNGFTLEPQAQIVYQTVSFDHARDAFGFVRFDDGDSVRGRLGLRAAKTWNTADEGREARLVTAWLRANIWHEFMGKTTTSWGSVDGQNMTPFNTYLGGTWGELGAGVTAQVTDKVNVFATGAYSRSFDNAGRQGWDGRLGVTMKW